jgi:hypothetical protein
MEASMRKLALAVLLLAAAGVVAFTQTQWSADPTALNLDNTCTVSLTTCNVSTDSFGQVLGTRAPREIQLGLKFYW